MARGRLREGAAARVAGDANAVTLRGCIRCSVLVRYG